MFRCQERRCWVVERQAGKSFGEEGHGRRRRAVIPAPNGCRQGGLWLRRCLSACGAVGLLLRWLGGAGLLLSLLGGLLLGLLSQLGFALLEEVALLVQL